MRRVLAIACLITVLLPALAFASEEGGGGLSSLDKALISLDKSLISRAVNCLIGLVPLTKLLYKPLMAKMDERTKAIQRSLDEAQEARAQAQKERDEFAAKIQAANAEAQRIRADALKE